MIKLADTLAPMSNDFYAVESENVGIDIDGTLKSIQQAYEDGDLGGSAIQVDTLPIASEDELGRIYQYTGDSGTYQNGFFYRCDYVEADDEYVWTKIVYGSNLQAGDGIEIENDTISVQPSYKKIFTGTHSEWEELTLDEKKSYDEADFVDDVASGFPVISDVVADGDENPVTSSAVYNHNRIYNIQLNNITINANSNYTVTLADYDININGKPWIAFIWNRSSFSDLSCFGDGSTYMLIHNGEAENKTGNIYIAVMVQE